MPNFEKWAESKRTMEFLASLDELTSRISCNAITKINIKTSLLNIKAKEEIIKMISKSAYKSQFRNELANLDDEINRWRQYVVSLQDILNNNNIENEKKNLNKQARAMFGLSLKKAFKLQRAYELWLKNSGTQPEQNVELKEKSLSPELTEVSKSAGKLVGDSNEKNKDCISDELINKKKEYEKIEQDFFSMRKSLY